MNIGIDISSLIYDRGVSRYTANLVKALAEHKDLNLFLYGASLRQESKLKKAVKEINNDSKATIKSNIQKLPPSLLTRFWDFGFNPIGNIFPKLDLFHSWDWIQPPDKKLPLVSTIHDLAILKYPETAHPKILKRHQKSWKILKQRKAHIIAVSQATKKDIVEELAIPSSRVHVIYEALPQETAKVANELSEDKYNKIKDKLKLDRPYLLFVGTREPRKNLKKLIKAWGSFSKTHDLIIAGEEGWDETSNTKSSNNPSKQNNDEIKPRFLGKVTDQELVVLYSEAECFVYPSLYEGFGLPILEAFSFGTPVVTSNISSMPEVAGNAAELVNPNSIEDIKNGIEKILHEPQKKQQERLQKMIIRLQLFSWKRVAKETREVYERIYRENQ
ncbi:MAG: glycosyltransferase family 4 protein [Candidatus Pacebacteria bacterium]|nr:glycosyltransferase family 4 protein [Candidatus Paceibacterota bacterium]